MNGEGDRVRLTKNKQGTKTKLAKQRQITWEETWVEKKTHTLVASCFRGALPPVDLRAVCFVRAIVDHFLCKNCKKKIKNQ